MEACHEVQKQEPEAVIINLIFWHWCNVVQVLGVCHPEFPGVVKSPDFASVIKAALKMKHELIALTMTPHLP